MQHFLAGFVLYKRPPQLIFFERFEVLGRLASGEMAITARPIGTAQSCCAQADPRTQYHDAECEEGAEQREAPEYKHGTVGHRRLKRR